MVILIGVLKRYLSTVRHVIADCYTNFKSNVIGILLSGVAGVVLQVVSFGLVAYYVRLLEADATIIVFDTDIHTRTSVSLLVLVAIVSTLVFIAGGVFMYYSRTASIRLGIAYELFCSKRVFEIIHRHREELSESKKYILKLTRTESRYCGRSLRSLMAVLVPLASILVTIPILLYIQFYLTVFLVMISVFCFYMIYRINVNAANSSVLLERYTESKNKRKKRIADDIVNNDSDEEFDPWLKKQYEAKEINEYYSAYNTYLSIPQMSVLATNLFLAIFLAIIIISIGSRIILYDQGRWSEIIIYLVALRYSFVSLQTIAKTVSGINRFFPQVRRYYQFIDNPLKHKEFASGSISEGDLEDFE